MSHAVHFNLHYLILYDCPPVEHTYLSFCPLQLLHCVSGNNVSIRTCGLGVHGVTYALHSHCMGSVWVLEFEMGDWEDGIRMFESRKTNFGNTCLNLALDVELQCWVHNSLKGPVQTQSSCKPAN